LTLFPRLLCVITGIASAAMLVRLIAGRQGMTALSEVRRVFRACTTRAVAREAQVHRETLIVLALSLAYPWLILKLGFLLATWLLSFLVVAAFRTPWRKTLLISVGVSVGVYIFFVTIIGAQVVGGEWFDAFRN
jgi:hypothetical protein